ncbi:MAG: metal ABC transporter ATP-binding protein [Verrucomicrobiota bacterium]
MSHHLILTDLTVSFNRIPAIHHINLDLGCGSCVGLLGPNGAGKSTLLRAIAGLLPIETGRIEFRGHEIGENDSPGKTIAYVPQREAVDWDFPITVRGLVEMGRYPALGLWKKFGPEDRRIVKEALHVMDLEDYAGRQISALSGGQQQRAFLARAWAQQSDIYLLDEPYTGLDRNARLAFTGALHKLRAAGKLIISSHHELNDVPVIFDRVILINGELVACGEIATAFTPKNTERAFATKAFSGSHYA